MRDLFWYWGQWIVRRQLRAGLSGVDVEGREALKEWARGRSVILAATHVSWLDGPLAVWMNRSMGWDARILMRADRLEQFPWFASFGAVGVASGVSNWRRPS